MIKTSTMLLDELAAYQDPFGKIRRMCQAGELYPLTRGLYETDANAPGFMLAAAIYGPSYLSFEYALSFYDLIPERVFTYTSATCGKRKKKTYENHFGRYSYADIPVAAFPYGTEILQQGEYACTIAAPEKAVCDKLYQIRPVHSIKALKTLLFEDLRIDPEQFASLDQKLLTELCPLYHSSTLDVFNRYL